MADARALGAGALATLLVAALGYRLTPGGVMVLLAGAGRLQVIIELARRSGHSGARPAQGAA